MHPRYEVVHLERLRLGLPYPKQVDHRETPLLRAPLAQASLGVLMEYTCVGRPLFNTFSVREGAHDNLGLALAFSSTWHEQTS